MLSAKELHKYIISKIVCVYNHQESSNIAFVLMEYLGVSKINYVLNDKVVYNEIVLISFIDKLVNNEPIQYVLGESWFYGRKFKVDENVLIPRPETEELCSLIIEKNQSEKPLKVIDIGTGSGCIPITLKLEKNCWKTSALDISKKAIQIAKENAVSLDADINFIIKDILNDEVNLSSFDVVVSNPPYVLSSEKMQMRSNVLENEPQIALFVEDDNPLLFYKKITELCVKGKVNQLYFEINEMYGDEIKVMMVSNGFYDVCIKKDFNNKDRIVYGFRK